MAAGSNEYYYRLLDKSEQQAYYAILEGLKAISPAFPVPRLSSEQLLSIYFMIRMDHPEIFYTTRFSYRYYENARNAELIPEYIFDRKKIMDHRQAMENRLTKLARAAETMTEGEKLLYIHDFICSNVTYDKLKKAYSHEIIGPLGTGVGVCEGIAKTVKSLCDRLGIWCIVALCGNNLEKGIKYRHTWNIVRIGGQYYHFDATFDNTLSKKMPGLLRYDYVKLSDKQIFRDHEPPIYPLPACTDSGASYYQEKKLSFTKTEDVGKRTAQHAKKRKPFVFHWRGGYLTREVLIELLTLIRESAASHNKDAAVSVNWPQAVLSVQFSDAVPAQSHASPAEPVMEQANEGELYDSGDEAL